MYKLDLTSNNQKLLICYKSPTKGDIYEKIKFRY